MIAIYADNFRGFRDTVIHLKSVNFLVGENSTGKTSILSLFSIFQDQTFWFNHDFNTELVNLGYFEEISVSATAPFRIGYADTEFRSPFVGGGQGEPRYYLLEFCNRDNIPTLTSIRLRSPDADLYAVLEGGVLRYAVTDTQVPIPSYDEWVRQPAPSPNRLTQSKFADRVALRPMVYTFLQAIEEETRADRPTMSPWGLFYPSFVHQSLAWIAPIRAKPKRTYDSYKVSFSPEGEHSPYLLKDLLSSKRGKLPDADRKLRRFGKSSGLFKNINIHSHGKGKTAPFEIFVKLGTKRFKIANVGYGVAQVLPIIVELLSRPKATWFAIQQPEVHLHPKAQAELGTTIFLFAKEQEDRFLIETHSDFLIDRFRRELGQSHSNLEAQLLFFQRTAATNSVQPVVISPSGNFSPPIPEAFRDFFVKEQLALLDI